MSAGLVAYKLCDRDLDCDACPFDAAMRGGGPGTEEAAVPWRPAPWFFPDDREYHPAHTWAQAGEHGCVRVGLDSFAARAVCQGTVVILPPQGSRLRQGHVAGWVVDRSVAIPLCVPLSGVARGQNDAVLARPALMATSPYQGGWLLEIEGRVSEKERRRLITAGEAGRRAEAQLVRIRDRALRELGGKDEAVGPTLPDGGDLLADLRRRLGARGFHRLVGSFLEPRTGTGKRTR
jgi:glycine cleavage system H protein